MAMTPQELEEAKKRLREGTPATSSARVEAAKAKLSASEEAASRVKADLKKPKPGLLNRAVDALGSVVKVPYEKVVAPATKAVVKDILAPTAATAFQAVRGAWNLASGNLAKEQVAQFQDEQRKGVDLDMGTGLNVFGTQTPVTMDKETGRPNTDVQMGQEVVGNAAKIASVLVGNEIAAMGKTSLAPKAIVGMTAGGAGGLLHGAGSALAKAGEEKKGALNTVADVASKSAVEGTVGLAAGYGIGTLEDWWNAPVSKRSTEPKIEPSKRTGEGDLVQQAKGELNRRFPAPNDSVKESVLAKAQAADDAAKGGMSIYRDQEGNVLDVFDPDDIPANITDAGARADALSQGPGAARMNSKEFATPKAGSAAKSAKTLIDSGLNPNRLDEMADMGVDDLNAIATATQNGRKILLRPGERSKIRLAEGLADNVEQNIDAAERVAAPYRKAISDAVRTADNALFDRSALDAKLAEALPSRTIKFSQADKTFVESLIDEMDAIKTFEDVHEFRQRIANETSAYLPKVDPTGKLKETEGTKVADALRDKMGEYLDEMLADNPVEVNGQEMTYGELRRRIRPVLGAIDEFWKEIGGKWKSYDGDARNRRLGEIAGKLSTNMSAKTEAAFSTLKEALKAEGVDVGGDLAKQASYVKFVEDLFNAGPERAIQQNITGGIVQANDLATATGLMDVAKHPVRSTIGAALDQGLKMVGISGERMKERATEKIRQAFIDYVTALLASKR